MKLCVALMLLLTSGALAQGRDSTILIRTAGESDIELTRRAAKILDVRDAYMQNGPVNGKTGTSDHFIVTGYNSSAIVLLHADSATGNRFYLYRIDFRREEMAKVVAIFYANADNDPQRELGFILETDLVAHDESGMPIHNYDYFTEFYEFNSGELNYMEAISKQLDGYSNVPAVKERLKRILNR